MSYLGRAGIAASAFGMVISLCCAGHAADIKHYDVMEFIGPAAGKETAFNAWYKAHAAQVLKVPGVENVQRFKVDQAQRPNTPFSPFYLQIELATADLDAAAGKLSSLMAQGQDVTDKDSTVMAFYEPKPKLMAKDVSGTTPAPAIPGETKLKTFYLLAMVNADPQHDAEFNRNYDDVHFPDVIRNPGVVWGQRAVRVRVEPGTAAWPGYLATYEYRAYDVPAANDEVNRRLQEHITRPLTFTSQGGHTWYSEATGPLLHAK